MRTPALRVFATLLPLALCVLAGATLSACAVSVAGDDVEAPAENTSAATASSGASPSEGATTTPAPKGAASGLTVVPGEVKTLGSPSPQPWSPGQLSTTVGGGSATSGTAK